MPAFSFFPESSSHQRGMTEAPQHGIPLQFIEDFKGILVEVRQSKQEQLNTLEERALAILDTMGVPAEEDTEAMEALEKDLVLIDERYSKLGKIVVTRNSQAGKYSLGTMMDDKTQTWTMRDREKLLEPLRVSDGWLSGKKEREKKEKVKEEKKEKKEKKCEGQTRTAEGDGSDGTRGKGKHNGSMTKDGPTQSPRRMTTSRMFDADQLDVAKAIRQKELDGTAAGDENDEDDEDHDDHDEESGESTGDDTSAASSYAARLVEQARAEMRTRHFASHDSIAVHRKATPQSDAEGDGGKPSKLPPQTRADPVKVKARSAKGKSQKATATPVPERLVSREGSNDDVLEDALSPDTQQTQNSLPAPEQTQIHDEPPLIPASWSAHGAWENEATSENQVGDTEDVSLDDIPSVPSHDPVEHCQHEHSPQASGSTSESSDNLFVTERKECRPRKRSFRSPAPPPLPRKSPSSNYSKSEPSHVVPAPEPEERVRREAAFLLARPKAKEVLLWDEQELGEAPLPRKRSASVDDALGAFVGSRTVKPPQKKAKGEEGKEKGGEKSPAPVKWPGQQFSIKDVKKANARRR